MSQTTTPPRRPRLIASTSISLMIALAALAPTARADVGGSATTASGAAGSTGGAGQGLLSTSIDNAWSITATAGGKLAMIATAVGVLVALLVFKSWKGAISVFGAAVAASWVLGGGFWSTAQDTSAQLSQGIGGTSQQAAGDPSGR